MSDDIHNFTINGHPLPDGDKFSLTVVRHSVGTQGKALLTVDGSEHSLPPGTTIEYNDQPFFKVTTWWEDFKPEPMSFLTQSYQDGPFML